MKNEITAIAKVAGFMIVLMMWATIWTAVSGTGFARVVTPSLSEHVAEPPEVSYPE